MIAAIQGAEVLLVGYEHVTARVIDSCPTLRFIGCSRSNPVNVDMDAASRAGIVIVHTPGRNAIAAAEFTLGLLLSAARNIASGHHALKIGRYAGANSDGFTGSDESGDITWDLNRQTPYLELRGVELNGRTLGLVGLGNVATRVAMLARAFEMRVLVYSSARDAARAAQLGIEFVPFDLLLQESDFISIHCKVTDETCAMFSKRAFQLMKPNAYLINTARAIVVDQAALIEALTNRQIAGAALDVFWYEPIPANHPLLGLDNVVLTPHLGGSTTDVPPRHSKMLVDDLLAWSDGKPLRHQVKPE